MNNKSTPFITKFLASLSVLNFLATMLCIIAVISFREYVYTNQFLFSSISAPAAEMLVNHITKTIGGMSMFFVIANLIISLILFLIAIITRISKRPSLQRAIIAS